jgi:hypothetical protein
MAGIATGFRKLDPAPAFDAGQPITEGLSQRNVIRSHLVGVDYGFTHAGTSAGTDAGDASHRLLNIFKAQGSLRDNARTFADIRARHMLHYLKHLAVGVRPQTEPAVSGGAGTTDSDRRSELVFPYYPVGLSAGFSDRYGLPSYLLDEKTFEGVYTWGSAGDLVVGETGTAPAFVAPSVQLYEEFVKLVDGKPVTGRRLAMNPAPKVTARHVVTAADSDVQLAFPTIERGNAVLRAFVVTEADGARVDTMVTALGLVINGETYYGKIAPAIYQRDAVARYPSITSEYTGVYFFDFVDDGDPRGAPVITSAERPYFLADVATPGTANIAYVVVEYAKPLS